MAIATPNPRQVHAADVAVGPIMRLFGAVCSVPSVRKVGLTFDGGPLDFWVFLGEDVPEDEERIYLALRAYRATPGGAGPLDLHVIPLYDVEDAADLPQVDILFER